MSFRILVQVWCEIDPTLNVRLDRQTGQPLVDPGDRLWRVSPLGRAAVAAAVPLGAATVTAFALGSGHTEALRHALVAGATDAVELSAEGADDAALSVAVLAEWLRQQHADLVIADRLAGLVAARLSWAHLAGLAELRVHEGVLRAVRFLGRGDREVVTARLPAAVRLRGESLRVPYVSQSRLRAAAERRIQQQRLPGPELSSSPPGPLQMARARTRLGQASVAAPTSASGRLQALMGGGKVPPVAAPRADRSSATPDQLAEEFIRYLLHHDLLPQADEVLRTNVHGQGSL
jgi:electron transfer flavoprotein alpha/beta subunit